MLDHNLRRVVPREHHQIIATLSRRLRESSRLVPPRCGPLLRSYQLRCIKELARTYEYYGAVILQLATAAGKTIIIAEMIRRLAGLRILVLVHRRELVRQASQKLTDTGVKHGIIAAGFVRSPTERVQVASVQSLVGRLDVLVQYFDFIVIDECHHTPAATWRRIFAKQPKAKKLGVTATPARLDGKGLGSEHGGAFDAMVCGPPIAELIEDG